MCVGRSIEFSSNEGEWTRSSQAVHLGHGSSGMARSVRFGDHAAHSSGRATNLAFEKQLSAAIVGIAIKINTLHAKMKLSQNKNQAAREDVLQFLQQTEQPQTVWQLMVAQGGS